MEVERNTRCNSVADHVLLPNNELNNIILKSKSLGIFIKSEESSKSDECRGDKKPLFSFPTNNTRHHLHPDVSDSDNDEPSRNEDANNLPHDSYISESDNEQDDFSLVNKKLSTYSISQNGYPGISNCSTDVPSANEDVSTLLGHLCISNPCNEQADSSLNNKKLSTNTVNHDVHPDKSYSDHKESSYTHKDVNNLLDYSYKSDTKTEQDDSDIVKKKLLADIRSHPMHSVNSTDPVENEDLCDLVHNLYLSDSDNEEYDSSGENQANEKDPSLREKGPEYRKQLKFQKQVPYEKKKQDRPQFIPEIRSLSAELFCNGNCGNNPCGIEAFFTDTTQEQKTPGAERGINDYFYDDITTSSNDNICYQNEGLIYLDNRTNLHSENRGYNSTPSYEYSVNNLFHFNGTASQDCTINLYPEDCGTSSTEGVEHSVNDHFNFCGKTSQDCTTNLYPEDCGTSSTQVAENSVDDPFHFYGTTSQDCTTNLYPGNSESSSTPSSGHSVDDPFHFYRTTSQDCATNLYPGNRGSSSTPSSEHSVDDPFHFYGKTFQDCAANLYPEDCGAGSASSLVVESEVSTKRSPPLTPAPPPTPILNHYAKLINDKDFTDMLKEMKKDKGKNNSKNKRNEALNVKTAKVNATKIASKPLENKAKMEFQKFLCNEKYREAQMKVFKDINRQIWKESKTKEDVKVIYIEDDGNASEKRTNLHNAVRNCELEDIYCLVEIHLDQCNQSRTELTLADKSGRTAIDYAIENKLTAVVEYLQGYNCRPSCEVVPCLSSR